MNKNEIDDAEIALKKERERARIAAYRETNPELESAFKLTASLQAKANS